MKRKWISSSAFLLVLFTALVGCSQNESASTEDDGKVTIKFHHWYNEDAGNWEEVIAAFEKEHPEINVESEPLVDNLIFDDYIKKLDLLASSGDQLDVFMFSSPDDVYAKRVSSGLVEPLNSYLEKDNVNFEEEYKMNTSVDGNYYGLPGKMNTWLILLNKDHLDAAGLPVPTDWTWDEYMEYAEKLTKGEGTSKQYGTYFHTWENIYNLVKLMSLPKETAILKSDGTSNVDHPLVKESLQMRYQMEQIDKTSVPLSDTLSQKLNYRQQFFTGAASMILTGSYMITEWGEFTPDFEMVWAPYPKLEKDDPQYANNTGDIISVAKNSEHKEEAYTFARWLSTEGVILQGKSIPAWKKADLGQVVDTLVDSTSKPEAIDKESFLHVLENGVQAKTNVPPAYTSEVFEVLATEGELYLLGEQDIDTTLSNLREKTQSIIDSNKK